jgi:hypothetical protein
LVLVPSLSSSKDETVGFVLEKHGEWYLDGAPSRALAEGDRLPAGAKIRPKQERPEGDKVSLTVCLYTGQAKVYIGPEILPARRDPSLVNRLWRAVAGRYSGGYVHALSRGKEISDGIVRLENRQIDLAPVFHADVEGEHQLRFTPMAPIPATTKGPVAIRFAWVPKRPSPVTAEGLRSGLYECVVVAQDGEPQGDATAWILLSEPGSYDRSAKTYREAVALSERWDEKVSPYAILSFRRACLKTLAEPAPP